MILAVGLDNSYGVNFIQLKAIKAKKKKRYQPTSRRLERQWYITKTSLAFCFVIFHLPNLQTSQTLSPLCFTLKDCRDWVHVLDFPQSVATMLPESKVKLTN